jgi:hypothetical protein
MAVVIPVQVEFPPGLPLAMLMVFIVPPAPIVMVALEE